VRDNRKGGRCVVTKTTALRTSIDNASGRSRILNGQSKPQHGATSIHPLLRLQQRIGNRAVARSVQARLQSQPHNPTSQGQGTRKAELEFHSALHFNRTFSGFSPTAEPEEGGYGILWWSVWNTGWTGAPEHTNRLTIYNANVCSGCRKQEDELSRNEIPGPAIVSGAERGKSDYENAVLVGPLSAGHYEAYVELDVQNQVEEINEDNNTAFLIFSIRPGKDSESASEGTAQSGDLIQRQPKSDGPSVRDVPILLEKLELDVGDNLLDYGHHLYRAATLYRDDPDALKEALGRYALGANVLKDTYRFLGFKADTAGKLAVGTGIVTKGVTLLRAGELTLDFQVDIGHGVKFETNLSLGVNPKDLTEVRKAEVHFGLVRRF
jgi:hypothetical protein